MLKKSEQSALQLRGFLEKYFSARLDLRVRLFNILALFGVAVSLVSAVWSAFFLGDAPAVYLTYLFFALVSLALIVYSTKTGRYQRCYTIAIVLVFLVGFPIFFFSGGGYHGSMPYFFVFAILFTIFMLEGKRAIAMSMIELVLYISICIYAWLYVPVNPKYLVANNIFSETVFGFSVVSIALGICLYLHFRLYNKQQYELRKSREAADAANEAKSHFLANMSHEIRTPLGIMLGMNEMILREASSGQIKGYAQSAEHAGQQLLTLINNILDVSAIEKGKLAITEDFFETAELISSLSIIGENLADGQHLSFRVDANETLPRILQGDMHQIRQIVANFLSNAVKYTEKGGIILSFSVRPAKSEGEIILRVSVTDTGIGINAENLPHLFDAFVREEVRGRYIEGSGLGLSIAKEYAERMGGHVSAESKVGHGSVFSVELPQKVGDPAPMGAWQQVDEVAPATADELGFTAPGCHVLIVDDNYENLQLTKRLLARTLMQVSTALSVEECLKKAEHCRYDVILMDYMMPVMDGEEALRRLQAFPDFDTPVIALTANVIAGVRERLLGAGFHQYLSKPIMLRDLEAALLAVLPQDLTTPGGAAPSEQISAEMKDEYAQKLLSGGIILDDGLRYAGSMAQYVRSVLIFTESYGAAITAVRTSADAGDWGSIQFRVHSLKGNARNLGANILSDTAAKLENLCLSGDGAYVVTALPVLYFEWERAKEAFIAFSKKLRNIIPAHEKRVFSNAVVGELPQMLKHNQYQNAMDILEALIAAGGTPQRMEQLRVIRQKTDELNFREAEQLLAALLESEAGGHGK